MHKPEIADYNLTQSDIQRARSTDSRREFLQQKTLPWIVAVGPIIVGLKVYLKEPSFLLAGIAGFFGGGIASIFAGAAFLGLWNLIWSRVYAEDKEILDRYNQYQKATKAFEHDQQRQLEAFWKGLTGRAFEHELAKLFSRVGYTVEVTKYSRDGGIDIYLQHSGKSTIVQCKRYSSAVGVATVRELYGVLQSVDADAAILASTGGFTKGVVDFVKGKPIELLGLHKIVELHKSIETSSKT
jgi:hypothetical protein